MLPFKVQFFDYDEIPIDDPQYVEQGGSAIPPENPTRKGYVFKSWNPSYTNVTSDLSCFAQYTKDTDKYAGIIREIPINEFNMSTTKHQYSDNSEHTVSLSKNVTGLNPYTSQ